MNHAEAGWPAVGLDLAHDCVNAWECDEMGHLNVRYYAGRAVDGLTELMARLGFPARPIAGKDALVRLRGHHIRMMSEVHPGAPMHVHGGIVALGDADATVAEMLYRSEGGAASAGFLTRIEHVSVDGSVSPWPSAFRDTAEIIPTPEACLPRGLSGSRLPMSVEAAKQFNMTVTGAGIIKDGMCDQNGLLRPDQFIAIVSDSTRILTNAFHHAAAELPGAPTRIGSAGVEVRTDYFHYPKAGDRFVVYGALSALSPSSRSVLYWMFDTATGAPLGRLESVEIVMDLDARRAFRLSAEAIETLTHLVVSADV